MDGGGANHGRRHASERSELQAERAIGGAGLDVVQEHQAFALRVVVLGGVEVDVGDAWQCVGECRQFEVMGCEQCESAHVAGEKFGDRACQRQTVVGRGGGKSAGGGKSGSVGVELGGRRIIKK